MEAIVAIALAVGFAFALSSIGAMSIDRAVSALAQFFGGWRGDAWPRGVQEEDPDRPWGARTRSQDGRSATVFRDPQPTLSAVRPVVRPR